MILKFKDGNAWNLIDNVSNVTHFTPEKGEAKRVVVFTQGRENKTLELFDHAYLLNDNGKTIETLV